VDEAFALFARDGEDMITLATLREVARVLRENV